MFVGEGVDGPLAYEPRSIIMRVSQDRRNSRNTLMRQTNIAKQIATMALECSSWSIVI